MHGSGWVTVAIRRFPKATQLLILSMNAQNREPRTENRRALRGSRFSFGYPLGGSQSGGPPRIRTWNQVVMSDVLCR
jgi:hypothetical protein